jgi:tRNA(adenine34) deaminase
MRRALELARSAGEGGDAPVGAVIANANGEIIGEGANRVFRDNDGAAHAEIIALGQAFAAAANYRLPEAAMVCTLEPCAMCAGAILHARLSRVYFGAPDDKSGAAGGVINLFAEKKLNHHTRIIGGVLAGESAALLSAFFQARR